MRTVIVSIPVDCHEYGEQDTDERATYLVAMMLRGEADLPDSGIRIQSGDYSGGLDSIVETVEPTVYDDPLAHWDDTNRL